MPLIVGIDAAYGGTGIAVYDMEQDRLETYLVPKGDTGMKRGKNGKFYYADTMAAPKYARRIMEHDLGMVRLYQLQPDLVVLEDAFLGPKAMRAGISLFKLQGSLLAFLYDELVPRVEIVSPMEPRLALLGTGKADKELALLWLQQQGYCEDIQLDGLNKKEQADALNRSDAALLAKYGESLLTRESA